VTLITPPHSGAGGVPAAATLPTATSRAPRVAHVATADLTHRFLLLPQLRHLRDQGYEVTAISAPGPWVADVTAEGIRHIDWPHAVRGWDLRADALAFRELVAILKEERFDLVHLHNPKPGIIGRVAATLAGVPCVVNTVHGFHATPDERLRKKVPVLALEWLAARFSDLELYQSQEDLQWVRRRHIAPAARTALLRNGCDVAQFSDTAVSAERRRELREGLGIAEGELIVGTVGRLVAMKGYRELFAAIPRVRSVIPGVRFLVVGSPDPSKADSIDEDEIARVGDALVYAGWRKDVRDLLSIMDVFVLPSWREGVPRSAIEAAAMGRPLVLTDVRGCREVVRNNVDGILVPVRDPEALAAGILRVLEDQPLRARLGSAARARALSRFDEQRVKDSIVTHYRRLMAHKGLEVQLPDGLPPEVVVRPAARGDAREMARLHRQSMPTAFLPALGERFLGRLYRALAEDPEAVALVADDGSRVLGFAAAVPSVRAFYKRFLVRHGAAAAMLAAPRLVRPQVLRRAIETATYGGDGTAVLPDAELLSIAVSSSEQGRGVGRRLADGVIAALAAAGTWELKVVVGADNERANRFYEGLGFLPGGTIAVHRGADSNVWVMS
jgi:glycosyltransferase involved in cell wall biosynthesis/ribosomal protein S18 acetylase RimI-like enzyme